MQWGQVQETRAAPVPVFQGARAELAVQGARVEPVVQGARVDLAVQYATQ